MYEIFKQSPFIRLLLPLIVGIWFGVFYHLPVKFVWFLVIITVISGFSLIFLYKQSANFKYRWLFGIQLYAFLGLFGFLLISTKAGLVNELEIESIHPQEFIGTVYLPPEQRTKSVQCYIETDQVKFNGKLLRYNAKILTYLKKDSVSLKLKAGDVLVFRAIVSKLKSSGNPNEFDFSKYLYYQNIRYSAYIDGQAWSLLAHNGLNSVLMWSFKLRDKLLGLFSFIGMAGDEYAVASALIIGDKANLDAEIKRAYISSGAMHILAVSGMHVALLYWVLNLFLSFSEKIKHGKYIKFALLLLSIWMYAIITGMSASVLRATVMFSFVIAGQASNRPISIFNSLAASAFFLLLWNPYNLVDAGFQLSYIAVLSIVILYPLIYKLLTFNNWLPNQIWSITACTIAAQIGTFPISIYYFHQFPNLFLISNLIIIPFSTFIIYFSILLIICSFSEIILTFLGGIFNWSVLTLNKVVLYIDQLPYALWKGLYINQFEMALIFGIIIAGTIYLVRKQVVYLNVTLVFVIFLLVSKLFVNLQCFTKEEVVFYNYQDNTVLQFRNRASCIWLVEKLDKRVEIMIEKNKYAERIRNVQVLKLDSIRKLTSKAGIYFGKNIWIKGQYIQFNSILIAIPYEYRDLQFVNENLPVDYLVLRNESVVKRNISGKISAKSVILDGTISKSKADKIVKILAPNNVEVYCMIKKGALRIKL